LHSPLPRQERQHLLLLLRLRLLPAARREGAHRQLAALHGATQGIAKKRPRISPGPFSYRTSLVLSVVLFFRSFIRTFCLFSGSSFQFLYASFFFILQHLLFQGRKCVQVTKGRLVLSF